MCAFQHVCEFELARSVFANMCTHLNAIFTVHNAQVELFPHCRIGKNINKLIRSML